MTTPAAAPRRIAHIWTPELGILDERVDGEFPASFCLGKWIYYPDVDHARRPLVRRGRWSGVETVEYRTRREMQCEDLPELMEAYGLEPEYRNGDDAKPRAD